MVCHRLLYKWTMHGKSPSITTDPRPYKIKVNSKIGDKNRVNTSNFKAKIIKLSEKLNHPFKRVFIFGNTFPESHGFVAMPVSSCIKGIPVKIYPYLISEGRRNCDQHNNETATLRKHVTKHKHMQKY